MSDPVNVAMHWVLTHKDKAQIRAEEESAGRLVAAWSRRLRRARAHLTGAFRRS